MSTFNKDTIFTKFFKFDEMQINDAMDVKKVYFNYKTWRIPGTVWDICGYSRAAYRTGFYISGLDLLLDAGPQHFGRPSTIMITHTHADHIANLPFTLIGYDELNANYAVQICGPLEAREYLQNYIDTLFTTNAMVPASTREELNKYYEYNGFQAGELKELMMKKERIVVQVFGCDHQIPTISYGFTQVKCKLKSEYIGMLGKDIANLRKNNVNVSENVYCKRFAYICDTTIRVFEMNPSLLDYPVIFIECTFIKDEDEHMAAGKHHIHWNSLEPFVVQNPKVTFMLFHFSQRYKDKEIAEYFDGVIAKKQLTNLHYWVNKDLN
jgi:ribonuclease Z